MLGIIFVMAFGGFFVIKSYLSQISRTYDQNFSETIVPEDEYFESDEAEVSLNAATDMDTVIDQESVNEGVDTGEKIPFIDSNDVKWDFIERIEDDQLVNILLVGQDRRGGRVVSDQIP